MARLLLFLPILLFLFPASLAAQTLVSYAGHEAKDGQFTFTDAAGARLRIRPYAKNTIRVQAVRRGEDFFPDDRYEMVATHTVEAGFSMLEMPDRFLLSAGGGVFIIVYKNPLRLEFRNAAGKKTYLKDLTGIAWSGSVVQARFTPNPAEHFCGLGHQAYGLVPQLDLKGASARSNYGNYDYSIDPGGWMAQANLNVPFYLSSLGYGVFLNSTFPNRFNFGKDGRYDFQVDGRGFPARMDYFFILGPGFADILDRYTELTGRPRMPQRSMFGLQLSDKDTPDNEGVNWWKRNISEHRAAGFPLDHVVNDNRWRAGTGAWSGSWFEWDKTRYPDPAAYRLWADSAGLTMTLDLNRNISAQCWGWEPSFNIPQSGCVKENFAVPDFSVPRVRDWVWELFWRKSLDPSLKYPGDALWMDEIDELICLPDSTLMQDGRSWAENANYYPFLVAKAVVQEGWDNSNMNQPDGIGEGKRPFMWGRGSTAGGQRYATTWSGDLKADYAWMRGTVRGMLASGLSGFPYFNHDAGGFRDPGPDDAMYIQWAMALGSFTPIWRPHGTSGSPRWPLRRSKECQEAAHVYAKLRYELMPYIYTAAHQAHATGLPMARPMVLDYQYLHEAWRHDMQYLWGPSMLVAPQTAGKDSTYSIWLPPGPDWYSLWDDKAYRGGQVMKYPARMGQLPVFVEAGAILPKYEYATSTFFQKPEKLILEVYPGKDGRYVLYEDDGVTERFRTRNEQRTTEILYRDATHQITIKPAKGTYDKAPANRSYEVRLHQSGTAKVVTVNGRKLDLKKGSAVALNKQTRILTVKTEAMPVGDETILRIE